MKTTLKYCENCPLGISPAEWLVAWKKLLMKLHRSRQIISWRQDRQPTSTRWRFVTGIAAMLVSSVFMPGYAQVAKQYPPLSEYLMPQDIEIALARSAAPANISSKATIKILTKSGFEAIHKGDNGFVCMVMRGWSAPTYTQEPFRELVYDAKVRAPICFDPAASRTVLPYYELRTKLGMEGKNPDQIAENVQSAYVKGELPRRDSASFAYMWSADQNLGPGVGHWHPHMMIFAPYYDNAMLGGNEFGSALPQVTDDARTPFTVIVIPVDHSLAVKAQPR